MDEIITEIREYAGNEPVSISSHNGRLLVMAGDNDIDLRDIISWVKVNEPLLLEQE